MTKSFTSEFPHVERYFWTMVNQPNFSKILGEVKQTESVPPVQSAKKPYQQKEPAKPKQKDEPKKESKKEPAKPKETDVAEEEEAPKPKPKNPLDLLPPSKMILDEWKRLYSNTKTNFREIAIKGYLSHFCLFTCLVFSFIKEKEKESMINASLVSSSFFYQKKKQQKKQGLQALFLFASLKKNRC